MGGNGGDITYLLRRGDLSRHGWWLGVSRQNDWKDFLCRQGKASKMKRRIKSLDENNRRRGRGEAEILAGTRNVITSATH